MNEFQVGQLVWSELQKSEVWVRHIYPPGHSCAGMVMVGDGKIEWGTDLSTLTPLEPRPGDSVQVVELAPIPSDRHEPLVVGSVHQVELLLNSDSCGPSVKGFVCLHRMGKPWNERGCWCKVILLRRASTPEVKERKFYEEMPSVLPSTLPAGTKSQGGRVALTDVTLSGIVYRGRWIHEETGVEQEMLSSTCVDWSLVEIQPSPPQPETSGGSDWVPSIGDECEGTVSLLSVTRDGETVVVDRSTLKPISPPPGGSADVPKGNPGRAQPHEGSGLRAPAQPSGGGSSCKHCGKPECLEPRPCLNCGAQVTCQNVLRDWDGGWLCTAQACREVSIYRDTLSFDRMRREGRPVLPPDADALYRLAASRKLAETRKVEERPSTHPGSWPEGSGEELRVS